MEFKDFFNSLSDDVKAKAKDIKTGEEFMALLEKENVELTPEQVEALSGGGCNCVVNFDCPLVAIGA